MSFFKYLQEAEHKAHFPVTGDSLSFVINQELAIECDVIDHNGDSCLIEADQDALDELAHCGHSFLGISEAEYKGRK